MAFREDLVILYQTIRQAAEAAEADTEEFRAAILGLQTENRRLQEQAEAHWNTTLEEMRRIWTYLYEQIRYRSNGEGNPETEN